MNGFTYRGRHCSEMGVNLLSYRVNSPDLREYEDEVAGAPGAFDYGTDYGKRQIDLSLDIVETDEPFERQRERIYNWFKPTLAAGAVVFDDMPERTYFAKLAGKLGSDQIGRYGTMEITLKCTDPFAYGPEQILSPIITTSPTTIQILSDGTEPAETLIEITNAGSTTINQFKLSIEYQLE
ncbi:distal tail protein Dit [Cohnella sp. GbtcB17]|uniref:distal tail protein Dit n=1 Tax=Cohnella sp. GbtcB17 TaxID=2824762 RepID=UPI001C2FBAAF|nr:distal tail protein Dit [Cohnella sp. GbtcB17]